MIHLEQNEKTLVIGRIICTEQPIEGSSFVVVKSKFPKYI